MNPSQTDSKFSSLNRSRSPEIEKSGTLEAKFYIEQDVYERQVEKVFASSWQFCGDLDSLDTSETILPVTLLPGCLDEPLILSRDCNDKIHVLSNVCTHRGSILIEEKRSNSKINCRYHGRCFSLGGTFLSAPGFDAACDFPSDKDNLPKLDTEYFGKFIFTSVQPEYPFRDLIQDMMDRVGWLPLEKCELDPSNSRTYFVDANWALYVDNYLEGLHIPFVHPGLAAILDTKNYKTELMKYGNLQIGIATEEDDAFVLPASSPDYGKRVAAYYYWLFPNTMFNFYPWGISINIVEPMGVDKTRIRFLTYVYDKDKMGSYSPDSINTTELEDEAVVEAVQKGMRSRLYNQGRYSPQWEVGVHQFHQLLTERLSTN